MSLRPPKKATLVEVLEMSPLHSSSTLDIVAFHENLGRLSAAELRDRIAPYYGQHVAWNAEGNRIVAGGDTIDALFEKLASLGIYPVEVVSMYVEMPGETSLGAEWELFGGW